MGDSKTSYDHIAGTPPYWLPILTNALSLAMPQPIEGFAVASGGENVSTASINIGSKLAGFRTLPQPPFVLLNWGTNDMGTNPVAATWQANYLTIADAIHAKWPDAKVYLMYPWRVGKDADAATLHGWIDIVIAARSFLFAGPDEAVWLKGSDNGSTNTSDNVHYSAAGDIACAAEWKMALGY